MTDNWFWRPISEAPISLFKAFPGDTDPDEETPWLLLWMPDEHGGLAIVGCMECGTWIGRDDERACFTLRNEPTHFMPYPGPLS